MASNIALSLFSLGGDDVRGFERRPRSGGDIPESAILIELQPRGAFVKVTAMDQRTLTEVSIVGDASKSQSELKQLAAQKLRYVLARRKDGARRS
jgi:hypothetical protein